MMKVGRKILIQLSCYAVVMQVCNGHLIKEVLSYCTEYNSEPRVDSGTEWVTGRGTPSVLC